VHVESEEPDFSTAGKGTIEQRRVSEVVSQRERESRYGRENPSQASSDWRASSPPYLITLPLSVQYCHHPMIPGVSKSFPPFFIWSKKRFTCRLITCAVCVSTGFDLLARDPSIRRSFEMLWTGILLDGRGWQQGTFFSGGGLR
jgi:hypothetical protein